jgi:protoporphyrin/coproporphyrin ferrochelatase
MAARKIAVILFNLGGPDSLEAVRPFLFNLFNDGAIIGAPQPIRFAIATLISSTREKLAQANYALMGGRSPLLPETEAQKEALQKLLDRDAPEGVALKAFIAMRYWKPFSSDAAEQARAWGADEAVLVPLYPQFSTTTTGSSIGAWNKAWKGASRTLCCYPTADEFAQAHADSVLAAWKEGGSPAKPRVLFSAHGLPKSIVDGGDPYQWQVEQTCAAVRALLPAEWEYRVCFQSRVGPMEWIGPSTEHEIHQAVKDSQGLIVSPIAFVSEHVETLVELDVEYGKIAEPLPFYLRAKAIGVADGFIHTLARETLRLVKTSAPVSCEAGTRLCPASFTKCPHHASAS